MAYILIHGTDGISADNIERDCRFDTDIFRTWKGMENTGYVYWHLLKTDTYMADIYGAIDHSLIACSSKGVKTTECGFISLIIPDEIADELYVLFDDGISDECISGTLSDVYMLNRNSTIDVLLEPYQISNIWEYIDIVKYPLYNPNKRYIYFDFTNIDIINKTDPFIVTKDDYFQLYDQSFKLKNSSNLLELELIILTSEKNKCYKYLLDYYKNKGWLDKLSI